MHLSIDVSAFADCRPVRSADCCPMQWQCRDCGAEPLERCSTSDAISSEKARMPTLHAALDSSQSADGSSLLVSHDASTRT